MNKCEFCHTPYVIGAVFCNECGNYLLEDDTRETDPLDSEDKEWVGNASEEHEATTSFQQENRRLALRLKIGTKKREIEAPLDRIINIGRVDPSSNIFPEVDLTGDDVAEKCVSRRHLRILKQDNRVVVEDVGSVNGTFINGRRLAPYLPETLNSGDTLQLGKLLIEVKILEMN